MGKLLKILGVSEDVQRLLPQEVYMAEQLIDGLQQVYASAPESPKKSQLALAISESVRMLMGKIEGYKIEDRVEDKPEEKPEKREDRPQMPKPPTPPQKPEKPQPPKKTKEKPPKPPSTPHIEEKMTCDEIKEAILGLTLLAKMGDTEAKETIIQLKNKRKNQNCK